VFIIKRDLAKKAAKLEEEYKDVIKANLILARSATKRVLDRPPTSSRSGQRLVQCLIGDIIRLRCKPRRRIMANIEAIREDHGNIFDPKTNKTKVKDYEYEIFNITAPVGPGMANLFGDVMVIQALINVIYSDGTKQATLEVWSGTDGFPPEYKGYQTPKVTGNFDKDTALAIKLFQTESRTRVLEVDGIVRPGSYSGRILKIGIGITQMLTIYELNDAARRYIFSRFGHAAMHTKIIRELFPQVSAALLF